MRDPAVAMQTLSVAGGIGMDIGRLCVLRCAGELAECLVGGPRALERR